ncbi:sulfatase-like hydrolase/transferase [Carboxylicivirga marina]|uniref:Sulfatase-like hydrolase/transferase n=1 Tax=Carboxylicivirga marina TaxID=2800988 RepID=A0ABS1HNI0_9BACT|nr:sulfatase-like hydrolase/transferase [Carboxylicivirga marina]MBK3519249.1 sulfatase-like hydrolase/transferase [Carboxylicivirga marina]
MISIYRYSTFLLVAFLFIQCHSAKTVKENPPNILFVLLDDMGKEWVSEYGAEEIKTPTIDQLGQEGIIFENAYSMPQCTPSRVALLTGQYPWRNGWINHYDVPRWGHGARFDPELNPSYAKILQKAGYKTCAAGKWQINDFRLEPTIMNDVGFDEYCMWTGYEEGIPASAERYWDPYIHTKEGSKTYKDQFGEDVFTDFIIDFMKGNKEDPFMVYYAMCLPHGPLVPTPLEPNVTNKMDKHKAMVKYTDYILDRLTNSLEELGLRENTIIIWTTDNGTAGNISGMRNGTKVKGGKTRLTENGINAPFIVNCPGLVPEGVKTTALMDFTDMLPTFADIAKADIPEEYITDGVSIADIIFGQSNQSKKEYIQALGSNPALIKDKRVANTFTFRDRVLRDEQYKVFVNTSGEIYALYDLINDPYEKVNLIDSQAQTCIDAIRKFKRGLEQMPAIDNAPVYIKGDANTWDIDTTKHNAVARKNMNKPNRVD